MQIYKKSKIAPSRIDKIIEEKWVKKNQQKEWLLWVLQEKSKMNVVIDLH